ncbi:MAG: hypothetical protein IKK83_01365 [Clostridia bacterium]|nr:hypothetical protein [Clostridia bacterium]
MMKNICKIAIMSGAVMGMMVGAASAYITAVMIKSKTSVCGVMKCKAKDAFKAMGEKFML